MELVKLKMKTSYKMVLSIVGILILFGGVILALYHFSPSFAFNNSDIEASGDMSVNYIDSKYFNSIDNNMVKFSITNSGNENIKYSINLNKVRGKGKYKLISNEKTLKEDKINSIDEINIYNFDLDGKDTVIYTLEINSEDELTGYISVKINEEKALNFADMIINNNKVNDESQTKVGEEAAIDDEGLIKSSDDLGTSYYFRGSVDNNYVLLNNILFRIVKINGDGTVKLVLNGETDTVSNYYSDIKKIKLPESSMNTFLKSWLNDNLSNELDYISNYKFCNDVDHDEEYNYNSYTRIEVNKIPTYNCLSNVVSSNVGLLTIDEVLYAGASINSENKSYYLYNENIKNNWYTLSAAKGSDVYLNMYMITPDGKIEENTVGDLYRGVRPVINLTRNIKMKGIGTINDPYVRGE